MNRPFPATARQQDAMRFIVGFIEANYGVAPSQAEIASALGLSSRCATHRLLRSLKERGWIKTLPNRARAIEVLNPPPIPRASDGAPLYFVTPYRKENP